MPINMPSSTSMAAMYCETRLLIGPHEPMMTSTLVNVVRTIRATEMPSTARP